MTATTTHPAPASRRRADAFASLIDEFDGGPPAGEPLPLPAGRFCLVEVDPSGAYWLGAFHTVAAALDHHDAVRDVADASVLCVVDLDTGERFDPYEPAA